MAATPERIAALREAISTFPDGVIRDSLMAQLAEAEAGAVPKPQRRVPRVEACRVSEEDARALRSGKSFPGWTPL